MKPASLLIVVLTTSAAFYSFGQTKFTSYDNTYAKKSFDIEIGTDKKGEYSLYINAQSLDDTHEHGGFIVKEKQYADFMQSMGEAKLKYKEWVKTAIDNNVKDLSKDMVIKCKTGSYFMYGNEWEFQFLVTPTYSFRILESEGQTEYLLLLRSGRLTSSSNQYMKVDGFVLVFRSEEEIDAFMKSISAEEIKSALTKPKSSDLFKN